MDKILVCSLEGTVLIRSQPNFIHILQMTRERRLLIFKVICQRSRSQIGNGQNPSIQPRGHSFDPILTKLHKLIAYDKRKNPIGSQGHRLKVKVTD